MTPEGRPLLAGSFDRTFLTSAPRVPQQVHAWRETASGVPSLASARDPSASDPEAKAEGQAAGPVKLDHYCLNCVVSLFAVNDS